MPLTDPEQLAKWASDWWSAADALVTGAKQAAEKFGDVAGTMRYGVGTAEKERLAVSGALPGAPLDQSADQDVANRYAAGYLFGQQYPNLAPAVQPYVDRIKTSDLPFFGGESPEVQSWASHGVSMGAGAPRTIGDFMGGR